MTLSPVIPAEAKRRAGTVSSAAFPAVPALRFVPAGMTIECVETTISKVLAR
jgi:hypothetical protein